MDATKPPHPKLTEQLAAEPDLVDRIFDYLVLHHPQLAETKDQIKRDVRAEFRGAVGFVPARSPSDRQQRTQDILRLFNGRNTSEIMRKLNVGRSTVYRALKQPGRTA